MANPRIKRITETSPNAAGTVVGGTVYGLANFESITLFYELVGATGGTLDVYLQTSHDAGATWWDVWHAPQIAAGAAAIARAWPLSRHVIASAGPVTIGKGTAATPNVALAANSAVGGACWGDRVRTVYVAGAGTTVGAPVSIVLVGAMPFPWASWPG